MQHEHTVPCDSAGPLEGPAAHACGRVARGAGHPGRGGPRRRRAGPRRAPAAGRAHRDLRLGPAPVPWPAEHTGVYLGHEFIGTVEDLGHEVRTSAPATGCSSRASSGAAAARRAAPATPSCAARRPAGVRHRRSTSAVARPRPSAVPAADASVLRIPEDITDEQAVLLTDILPTGYLGAQRADIQPGDTVVVIGLGPVGVFALQCARSTARPGSSPSTGPRRLARAEALGAEPIDATGGDTVAAVLEATGGRGAHAVIEAVGADQTVSDAIFCAAPGGTRLGDRGEPEPRAAAPDAHRCCSGADLPGHLRPIPRPGRRSCPLSPVRPDPARRGLHPPPGAVRGGRGLPPLRGGEDGVLKVLLDPASLISSSRIATRSAAPATAIST